MGIRHLIGEILTEMGFVTREQLAEALQKQKELIETQYLPERLARTRLIAEARADETAAGALLGDILLKMGILSRAQLEEALWRQKSLLAQGEAVESNDLLSVLTMGALVNSALNLNDVLGLIVQNAGRVTHSAGGALMLLDEATGELQFSLPIGPAADKLTDVRIAKGQGVAGWVAEQGEPAIVPDAQRDPRFYPGIDRMTGFETRSILAVPLKAKTGVIGVLAVINKQGNATFTEDDALLLSIFASQAVMAIENARLYGELKEQFEERKRMEQELVETEKFRMLGQLSAGVAHDFNNILAGLQGYVSLLQVGIGADHPHAAKLEKIDQQIRKGANITRQLLGFAQKGKYEVRPTDLNALVLESSEIFGQTKREIAISADLQQGIWTVAVDRGQIEQVLMNLYINAWQAMPSGGELRLTTCNRELDGEAAKPFRLAAGRYVLVSVADTGIGMDEATQQRIFEPFFTTKSSLQGTGLGLASAYGIMSNHGGAIAVHSAPGQGSRFELYLPATEGSCAAEEQISGQGPLAGRETILLVDDEPFNLSVNQELLENLGYRIITAENGQEALTLYMDRRQEIDLVILDLIMPGMGGGKAFEALREINPAVKVLLCSGYSADGEVRMIMQRGCNGFLQKPFRIFDLSQKIREIL